jgi:polyisoprenoid-binding protein YceI
MFDRKEIPTMNSRTTRTHALLAGLILLAAVSAGAASAAETTSWTLDPAHTEIKFSVNHFFTPVTGRFAEFEVDLAYDVENPENSTVEAKIPVASVDTGNAQRDEHLRSADWFEVETHPYITFKSTSVRADGSGHLVARGPLTIKGVSQVIELPITLLGRQPIPEEMREMLGGTQEVASFEASTAVERGNFGVGVGSWAATMVVGGDVEIEILAEAHRR